MKTVLKPERLCPGDTVGLIAPASAPPDPKSVDRAAAALEKLGYKPKLGKNIRARHGFIAGTDRERAADVMAMFTDKRVKAIFCLRGGYGCTRIMDRLDLEVIRRNPKIFSGYSDITAFHNIFASQLNLVSFHAPMWNGALADPKVPAFTKNSFFKTVTEPEPAGNICDGYDKKSVSILRPGIAEGRLVGGNLSLICSTLGTPFAPSFKNKILFFEDISERPYRLDRLLTHLWTAGVLSQVAGVAVGVNADCDEKKSGKEYQQNGADVVKERLEKLRVPVVTGLPFGHVDLNATIPVHALARLDAKRGDLIILESAVK
ncbi:MAG TPA: LD-carboxypeptidase [Candidatus Sulfotelmatobacter sp.]|jgi:muramoyltetrapeptide carboxypeptidase|nr:LD-carboxypeptidase [Candidatus Sulfotelmatobacter sp.]